MVAPRRETTGGLSVRRGGFTLTELLVVIGIMVLLLGLAIPTGQSLREGNRALTCKAQLQQIGQALRMYQLDAVGVPPFYVDSDEDWTDAETYPAHGPGLRALYQAGYLTKLKALHCPRDVYTEPQTEEYYESYMLYDADAAATVDLNRYSYLSTRGVIDDTDKYYRRQLQPAADVGGTSPAPVAMPGWRPADDTVVTWCPHHTGSLTAGGQGLYQVLFWDGSVKRIGEDVMCDAGIGPDAAWKVTHGDAAE